MPSSINTTADAVMPAATTSEPVGTLLAFDYGERYVGVAVGEAILRTAHPLTMIDSAERTVRFEAIGRLVEEWRPTRLIVGLPLAMDGTPHALSARAERFAIELERRFKVPITMVDERLTSVDAEASLAAMGRKVHLGRRGQKAKNDTHALAAQIILQSYFDDETSRR